MSDTRPPITAGPIERAFKFLKNTSVSCVGVGEGVGVADAGEEESVGAAGEAVEDRAGIGVPLGGVSTCAGKTETNETSEAHKKTYRPVIGSRL
ncbi:MAG: hypothetical protein C5B58_04600 [Acidobacteria bacterium]|nr:MAG: hypothetical protein C5B58_04600 [Acidobacteriota bacterium]